MKEQTKYLTNDGYQKIKQELDHLKKVKRPEISDRIKQAKDYGDLSENAEYADAREEQSFVEGRILELEDILKNSEIVESGKSDPSVIQIGDEVIVEKEGKEFSYTIVGSNESDPSLGRISNESPIGKALLGKRKGEEAKISTPKGESIWKVVKIITK